MSGNILLKFFVGVIFLTSVFSTEDGFDESEIPEEETISSIKVVCNFMNLCKTFNFKFYFFYKMKNLRKYSFFV